jgi:hypothetical protein
MWVIGDERRWFHQCLESMALNSFAGGDYMGQ